MTISPVRIGPSVLARAWIVYLILGILVVAAYFVAIDPNLQDAAYNLCGASAVGAMFIGAWLWRPERLRAWMLLAVGVALQSLGDVMLSFLTSSDGIEPFPSAADVPYLAGYVLIAFGLVELVRAGNREHDRTAWVDALIVAAAAAIFIWVLVIRDEIASSADVPTAIVAAAYPFFDIVQIAVVAHLILGGRRTPAVILLGAGFGASLVADLAYAVLSLQGAYHLGQLVDAGWLLGYLTLGAAALHPSMAISAAGPPAGSTEQATVTRRRLLLLAGGATTGPLVIAFQALRGEPPDTFAIAIGLSVVYLLVLGRVVLGLNALQDSLRERSNLAAELATQASHDPLTGLANRRLFLARLEAALARSGPGQRTAVLYLDLDRVKAINDSRGHAAGDAAIAAVAERLRSGLRSADTVARLGGDEFGILLGPSTEPEALAVAARINALLEESVSVGEASAPMSASVGLALAAPGDTVQDVIRNADQAMYRAKSAGGGSFVRFSDEMRAENAERLQLHADLPGAIARREFVLHYQPIIDLASGGIVGLEALVRWAHPTRGLLPPGSFIGLAEETGLIVPLGRWIFREAVRQASAWQHQGLLRRPFVIDVNVAARQLADPRFTRDIAAAMTGSGMGVGRIAVELTETELIRDPEAVGRSLEALRKGGLRVFIDDFGTAYASMSYLVNFPVDGLKIDRQFVHDLDSAGGPGRALVASMVGLARELGIWAVAEGVETEAQAEALRRLGCAYAQGFLFSRPIPADDVVPLLRAGVVDVSATGFETHRRRVAAG